MKQFSITKDQHLLRIDKFLRKHFASLPLSTIYKFLRKKTIKVNGGKVDEKYILQEHDVVDIYLSDESLKKIESESKDKREKNTAYAKPSFEVLYEDDAILVVNKPGDLAVHAGTSVGYNNLINQVLTYTGYKGEGFKPALAHRLDMQTSGIVLIGKTREALLALNEQIKQRSVKKYYTAMVLGVLDKPAGVIKIALTRQYSSEKRFKVRGAYEGEQEAQEAETRYVTTKKWSNKFSLLRLQLITGRTHQIRTHLATIGHPIIGDATYGNFSSNHEFQRQTGLKRQFLHASELEFMHPMTKKIITIHCELPQDLEKALQWASTSWPENI